MAAETKAGEMQVIDLQALLQRHLQYLPAIRDRLLRNACAEHFLLYANILPMHLMSAHCETQMYTLLFKKHQSTY
jgi:hypothetical protein